jgi:acyl-CoA thioester hydrolase
MKIRVYYDDTDCGGVVYYANYLRYMEHGRTELLREKGIELKEFHDRGIVFAVTKVNVTYRASARYNDLLDVRTVLTETSSVTLMFRTEIRDRDGALLVTGDATLACVNDKGKACRIPADMLEKLNAR